MIRLALEAQVTKLLRFSHLRIEKNTGPCLIQELSRSCYVANYQSQPELQTSPRPPPLRALLQRPGAPCKQKAQPTSHRV